MTQTLRLAAITFFAFPLTLHATDPTLDSAFVTTISPGLTPESYVPPPASPSWASGTGAVNAVALQSDGKIIAGGNISRYKAPASGSPQTSLKRLNPDGSLDTLTSFNTSATTLFDSQGQTEVNKILTVAGDKLYVGGVFTSYEGINRSGLMRLNADGSLDTAFATSGITNSNTFSIRYVLALAEQPADGKLLVGGGFNRANGTYRANLARFNADGSLDTSFNANAVLGNSTFVGDIAVLPNGQILVAGGRTRAGGGGTPLLVRLNSDGTLDPSLAPSFADEFGDIDELLVLPDGRSLIGGDFTFIGSGTNYNFASLLPNGTLDTAFMTNLGSGPSGWAGGELALQPDGTIFAGGIFKSWNNQPRASIARIFPDGTLDTAFAPPPYVNDNSYLTHFYSFAFQPDGKLVAGGWLARVSDPAVETYNLTRFVNEFSTGPGTLRALSPALTTTENAGSVALSVSRFSGLIGAVSVNYTLTPLTAIPGTDYTPVSGTLSWAAGVGGIQTITVPILQDATQDGLKAFQLTLSDPTGGATLPPANSTTLVGIRDDDAPPVIVLDSVAVTLDQGANFSLVVFYDSVLPATVQWQRDPDGAGPLPFVDVPGATSLVYSVANADLATHSGFYRAVVSNPNGATQSAAAEVAIATPAGSVVTTFAPASIGNINVAIPDSTGRILALTSTGLRRIAADGTVEATTSFGLSFTTSTASSFLPLADGRTLIGGSFTGQTHQPSSTATSISRLVRLNADATGTVDTGFSVTLPNSVNTLAAGASAKFYVGLSGASTSANGLLRFLSTGVADTTWTPVINTIATGSGSAVYAIRELSDGRVLVSYIQTSGGTSYILARLTATGALDPTFGTGGRITFNQPVLSFDVLPDGRIAAVGTFSTAAGLTRNRVAILLADGGVDPTFEFPVTFNVGGIPSGVTYRDGRLLVSGSFTTVNSITQGNLARLNLDGSVDTNFSIGVAAVGPFGHAINSTFYTSTGDIFIAGNFTSFKGVSRNSAALLVGNPQIGAVGFAPPRVSPVEAATNLALTLRRYGPAAQAASITYATADGTALAGTDYTAASGTVSWVAGDSADKTVLIPLLNDSSIESSKTFRVILGTATGPVSPAASATVTIIDDDTPVTYTLSPVALTNLNVGGALSLTATTTSPTPSTYQWFLNGVAISGATTASYAKNPVTAADAGVYTLVATNTAGAFTATPALVVIRPQPGRPVATGQATTGRPVFGTPPAGLVIANDGFVYVGGSFTASIPNNVTQANFIRVKPDGSTDTAYTYTPGAAVTALARQTDGKILLAGSFANRVVRLNADGTLDTAFATALGTSLNAAGQVNDFTFDSTGRIYVGGANYVFRLSAAGSYDAAYAPALNGAVTALAVQNTDDKLIVGGSFSTLAGSSAGRLGRLNTDGTRDPTFVSGIGGSGIYNDLLVLADGRILVAGSNFANTSTYALVNSDGSFGANILSSNQVYRLAQAPGGKVVNIQSNASSSLFILRLLGTNPLPNNDFDTTFNIGTGPNAEARALSIGPDGGIWITGLFTNVNGVTTGGIAKLNGDPVNPAIVNQPVNLGVAPGGTARFGVGAFGTALTYQWFKDASPLSDGGDISGATTAVLTIANADLSDDADYTVQVTGGTPSSTVTSTSAHLYVLGTPVVATPPAAVDIVAGPALTVSAQIFAAAPANYVWTRDGVPVVNDARISGATTAALTFSSTIAADTGTYTLTITNTQGTATTSVYVLVRPVPSTPASNLSGLSSSSAVRTFTPLPDSRMIVGVDGGTLTNGASSSASAAMHIVNADGTVANLGTDPSTGAKLPYIGGAVFTTFRQPNGQILIGGTFTTVNGVTRNRIARLNADGSLDTNFDAGLGAANQVNTIALDSFGRILVGGAFTNFAGVSGQNYLVRLDATTGALDTTWTPGIGATVTKILPLPAGGYLVGGSFFSPASHLVRYDNTGSRITTYFHAVNAAVTDLALTPDGTAFYASSASSPYLARFLLATGAADPAYGASTAALAGTVQSLAVQPNGKVLAYGSFNSPGHLISRLLPTGALDSTFSIGGSATTTNNALALDPAGRVWVGGSFTTFNNVTPVNRIAVLEGDLPAIAWNVQPLPRAVAAGETISFTASVRSTAPATYQWFKNGLPLTNGDRISGATSTTLSITGATVLDEGDYTVSATTVPSGTITSVAAELVFLAAPEIIIAPAGGTREAGVSSSLFVQARGAGTLNYQWFRGTATVPLAAISGATSAVYTLASPTLADTAYYRVRVTNTLGEVFSTPVLVTYATFAGASAGVSLPTFNNNTVQSLVLLPDGGFLAGGGFISFSPPGGSSVTQRCFAAVTSTGALNAAYARINNTGTPTVIAIVRDSQGRATFAGGFNTILNNSVNVTRNVIARLNADGTLDTAWNSPFANVGNPITTLAVDSSDRVLVGGNFTAINGAANTSRLARLDATTGAIDTTFVPPTLGDVNTIRVRTDGRILVGHSNGLALLEPTGALASGFTYAGSANVTAIQPLTDGGYLLGTPLGLQRITATGTLVAPFPASGTGTSSRIRTILALPDGDFLIGGDFTTYNNVLANRILKIRADGTASSTFSFGDGFNESVYTLTLDGTGRIWAGGGFTTYRGANVGRLTILNGSSTIPADPGAPVTNTPFEAFLAAAGIPTNLRGPNDDADSDGLDNLLEYALDLNPNGTGGTYTGTLPTFLSTPTQLSYTYRRVRNDVTYIVETSPTLIGGTWTSVGVTQGTPAGDGTTTASIPVTPGSQFLRLSVSR